MYNVQSHLPPSPVLSDLVLLCTKPYSNTAVLQCITFLTKVLKEADNTPDAPHLVAVVEQISNLSSLSPNELQEWMTAVFLTKDSLSTEDYFNIGFCKEFFYFVECLKSPNWLAVCVWVGGRGRGCGVGKGEGYL